MITKEPKERKSGMVRVRGGFSDTNKLVTYNTQIQMHEFDDESRIQINNVIYMFIEAIYDNGPNVMEGNLSGQRYTYNLIKDILNDVLCESNNIDEWNFHWTKYYDRCIKDILLNATYNEVLDLIQYFCQWIGEHGRGKLGDLFCYELNLVFEKEYIGYRFIEGRIVAITDKQEIESISEACQVPFEGCRKHIEKAVGFLADRENKDYKNCIKESISAVESVCQIILNNNKTTLSDALKQLEKKGTQIHPALNHAFLKLYAYSCDQGGIRHAEGLTESDVSFEEAKFMLVSCCAFTNYLIAEYGKKSD